MKNQNYNRQNGRKRGGQLNYEQLMAIGRATSGADDKPAEEKSPDQAQGLSLLLGITKQPEPVKEEVIVKREPVASVSSVPVAPNGEKWWLDNPSDQPKVTANDCELVEVDTEDVTTTIDGIRRFSDAIVTNLESSAASLRLSTGNLFEAGLRIAVDLSLLELMGITRDGDGSYKLPDQETIENLRSTYEIFQTFGAESITEVDEFLRKYGDNMTGIDSDWENILNGYIAEKTNLTADDSLKITNLLAQTWCDDEDESEDESDDETISLEEFFGKLTAHHDHCDCDDDDDDEDEGDDCISVILESGNDGELDVITVTGIDNRTVTFFVNYDAVVEATEKRYGTDKYHWEWLRNLMPSLMVSTADKETFYWVNARCEGSIRLEYLFDEADKHVFGLYTFEEGLFDELAGEDGPKLSAVLNYLFAENINPTLSQLTRLTRISSKLMISEKELFEVVSPVIEMIESDKDTEEEASDDTESDDQTDDPSDAVDLADIGAEIASDLKSVIDTDKMKSEAPTDTQAEPVEEMIFKPITRKRNDK